MWKQRSSGSSMWFAVWKMPAKLSLQAAAEKRTWWSKGAGNVDSRCSCFHFQFCRTKALIKNIQSDRLLKEAIVLDMGDLGRQADRLLSGARAEAQRLVDEARSEADRVIDGADQRGYSEGLERGLTEGR